MQIISTEFGEIPKTWDVKKVKDVGRVVTGKTPPTKEQNFYGNEFLFVRIPDMGQSVRVKEASVMLSAIGADYMPSLRLPPDSVMVSCIATIGNVGITSKDSFTNQQINSIIPNLKVIIPEWIYYFFKLHTNYLESLGGGGSVYTNISKSKFENAIIAVPPLPEQRAITKVLFDLDEKIELNNQMNKTLEAIGQAIFRQWFVDFEFPDKNGKPHKSSGGKMIDSELGEIPEGWAVKEISDCGEVVCGKTPPTADKDNYGNDIFFITIPDMRGQAFVIKTERGLSKKGATTQKKKELPPLAICVSCIATPGLVSLTSGLSHTNQQINSIVCNKDTSPFFMYYKMLDKSEEIKSMGLGGTATLNLNTGDFARIKVVVPEKVTMDAFHKSVIHFMERILSNSIENDGLCNICDSLLPKLISGKIRLNA